MNAPAHRPQVLVSAASAHGSTTEIARVIGQTLVNHDIAVDMIPPAAVDYIDDYDAVILGSAVYTGQWLAPARGVAQRGSLLVSRGMSEGDFRDWAAITQWADGIAAALAAVNARDWAQREDKRIEPGAYTREFGEDTAEVSGWTGPQ